MGSAFERYRPASRRREPGTTDHRDRGLTAADHVANAKDAAARRLLRHSLGKAAVDASRPHIWREVAAWVRDTCEQYDDGRLCEECADRADLLDHRAAELEEEQRGS